MNETIFTLTSYEVRVKWTEVKEQERNEEDVRKSVTNRSLQ
jgi:hypothetical protein